MVDVEALVADLTLEEKCRMVVGEGPWIIPGCERLGIPDWCVSDGPVGVRGRNMGPGMVVPGPSAIAATWNPALAHELGQALATEAVDRKVDMILAPTVNLHRSPRGGRHFESYSEDPELSSRIAASYITGIQSQGVGACVKHFVANDQEFERRTINVAVDERSLREIYLPPFEAAVKQAGVRAVMGAYNFVNGHHACAQPEMLIDVLKKEWGFDGLVVSDWGAIKETVAPALYGLDLEMPGPGRWWGRGLLLEAVEAGKVDESLVDDKVRRIVGFLNWAGRIDTPTDHDEASVDRLEHRALARRAAAESMVLISNDGGLLPLAGDRTVALIGPGAAETALFGGGSASLVPHRTTSVLESLAERLGPRLVGHAPGIDMRRKAEAVPESWIDGGVQFELYDGIGFDGKPFEILDRPLPFNAWIGDNWPKDCDAMSVRLEFTMTPEHSGRHRLCALGFAHARLFVDGQLVADNHIDRFSAGLGLHGGHGYLDLEAGHPYRIRLDHVPPEGSMWVSIVDVGVELADVGREESLSNAATLAAQADTAVVVVGSSSEWESEGSDRDSIELPNNQDELVERVLDANPNTVVVLNCGAPMTMPWLDRAVAVVLAWYPGQEAGEAIADVLVGDADPGGRMPTSWAWREQDTPAFLNYPGEAGVVRYGEGIFVGYRWYDARGIEPMIPFGHGGSYTTFEWGSPEVSGEGTQRAVTVPITNTGNRRGSEVVQIYVAPPTGDAPRPPKELAGFAKLTLDPGETAIAEIALKERSFARWDPQDHHWAVDPGQYRLAVAASATDIRSELAIEV